MGIFFMIVFFLLSLMLIGLILLQEGKGGGLTGMSAGMDGVMGAKNPLRRLTAWLFAFFVILAVGINWYFHIRTDASLPAGLELSPLAPAIPETSPLRPDPEATAAPETPLSLPVPETPAGARAVAEPPSSSEPTAGVETETSAPSDPSGIGGEKPAE